MRSESKVKAMLPVILFPSSLVREEMEPISIVKAATYLVSLLPLLRAGRNYTHGESYDIYVSAPRLWSLGWNLSER